MSEAGVKVTEAHESLQRWLKANKDVDIPVEHVAAVVLNFPTWQRSPQREAERIQARKDRDAAIDAAREAKRVEQDRKRQEADEKREKARIEADEKRRKADEARAEKRRLADEKRQQQDAERAEKAAKREQERQERQAKADKKREEAEAKKQSQQEAKAKKAEEATKPAENGEAQPQGGLREAKKQNRQLRRRTEQPVGASADTF